MKHARGWLVAVLIIGMAFSFGCAKKTIRSDAGFTPGRVEPRGADVKPEGDKEAALDKEKMQEENLREQALREQALREQALRDEARRKKEAADREAALKALKLEPIYFDFDTPTMRDDQKEVMQKNAEWLKANPGVKVRLEGHCDERGTSEYNLALGQKRADSARIFLEGLGISSQRLSTVSYGKERPLNPGHNEDAWAKNRRVDVTPNR